MRIGVLGGAGAMGGIFGGRLAQAGEDVILVDVAQPAVDTINEHGLILEDRSGHKHSVPVKASTRPADVGPVDLLLVFVKCYHTEAAVQSALPMIGPSTTLLTLQNGWGNAPRIANVIGQQRLMVGLTYHSGTLIAPGHVKHTGIGMTYVGELTNQEADRLNRVAGLLRAAGMEVTVSHDILKEIWSKLALNVCTLPTSALLRFTADQLVQHEGTLRLMQNLLREAVAIAQAQGIALDYDERWQAITTLLEKAVGARASMLQDVENGRRTEIDVVNGAIVEAGKQLDIPTPYNDSMVWLIRSLEETFQL
jgi:2-dehydropantoate 2-reductase